jgi:hypothetical protein
MVISSLVAYIPITSNLIASIPAKFSLLVVVSKHTQARLGWSFYAPVSHVDQIVNVLRIVLLLTAVTADIASAGEVVKEVADGCRCCETVRPEKKLSMIDRYRTAGKQYYINNHK